MTFPRLELKGLENDVAQDNFQRIDEFFKSEPFSRGEFKFFEFVIPPTTAAVSYPYTHIQPHSLGFMPKDVLQTHNRTNTAVTWNFDSFTDAVVSVTVSAATTLRAFIGRYNG